MSKLHTRAVLTVLCTSALLSAQKTHYVDVVNGAATNGGTSPSNAFRSISQAAASAGPNDTILVLPGVYDISVETSFPINFGIQAQDNVRIIAVEGPSKTFIDGSGTYNGIGMVRFRELAPGARISGFTFRNMSDDFWSCGIRLGSASGDQFRAVGVEVDNCVFDASLSRAFVVFGSGAGTRQSTGMRIHDNLIVNLHSNRRSVEIDGDGDNWFYNNTLLHSTNTINRAAIYIQSIVATAPAAPKIFNNIVIGGGTSSWGIEKGVSGDNAVIQFNNSFGHAAGMDYVDNGKSTTPHASNMSVDPEFVGANDYHLKSTSKMINAGTDALPLIRSDLDGYPHRNGMPDLGAYETHTNDFTVSVPPKIAGNIEFQLTGVAGVASIYMALDEGSVFLPGLGQVLIDPTLFFAVGVTAAPGKLSVAIPNNPSLEGISVVFQALHAGAGTAELLNVFRTYVRK